MQIRIFDTPAQIGQAAATLIASHLLNKPESILGLATGSSPIPTYRQLIELNKQGVVDFSKATSFNLDEYVGIPENHECSYHRFMNDQLFDHVNMRREAIHVPNGNAADMAASAAAYDAAIVKAGNIDMQLLGIGRNGHIGFNEPGEQFIYGCHVVELSKSTIDANKRFFASEDDVPRQAVSLGIGAIMNARQVLLIATGAEKAEAIRAAVHGDVTPKVQASILRTHSNVIFLLDKAAAQML